MKPFAFIFSFLLIFANLAFVQPSETFAKPLDNAVTISVLDVDGGDIVGMKAVEIEDGDTALDVLEEVSEVEVKDSEWGPEIKSIEGVFADSNTTNSYWAFYVNGGYASVGAGGYEVQHGDNILFLNNNEQDSLKTKVTIEGFETTEVETSPYSSAYDAVRQAVDTLKISIDYSVDSDYYVYIDNFSNKTLQDNEYWNFIINDESAQIGISSYQLSQDDHISFKLVTFDSGDGENQDDSEKDTESNDENNAKDEEQSNNPEVNDKQDNEENEDSTDEKETEENEQVNPNISVINKQVTDDLADLKKEIEKRGLLSGYGHEAYVWAYAKAGGKVLAEYRDNIAKELKEEDNFTTSTNELAKVIIALSVAGFDATDVDGVDLVDILINDENILTGTSVATPTYVLHAFDVGNYDVSESIKKELIDTIIGLQTTSGGWGFMGDTPSPDMTGMVLNTLAPYKSDEKVATAAEQAIDYLADGFDGTGWYYDEWSGGYTSEAISQVIVGLSAYGIDPTVAPFVDENGKDLLSYLLDFKAEDGLYKHVADGESDIGFATSQAFLALAYYKDAFIQETETPKQEEESEKETEKPKEETPSKDNEDKNDNNTKVEEDGTTTTNDSEVKVTESTTKAKEVKDETLPQTNSNVFNILAIGLLLLATGIVLVVLRKKWQSA